MSKYTVLNDPLIDRTIQKHLDYIATDIRNIMGSDLYAIILTGGFGRGEGSVKIENNHVHIVNDYDIEIVYRKIFNKFISKVYIHLKYGNALASLANLLADKFKMKQIDLTLKGQENYSSDSPCTMANFDTRYGSVSLYGIDNPAERLPKYSPDEIPVFEGSWLLRNRGIGLLLAHFYLVDNTIIENKHEYFYIEIIKSILAMGDALMISNGTYHNSYEARKKLINNVILDDFEYAQTLSGLYALASEYKLRPRDSMFEKTSPAQLWQQVANIHWSLMLYYESKRTGVNFNSVNNYIQWAFNQSELYFKHRLRIKFDQFRGRTDINSKYLHSIKHEKIQSIALCMGLLHAQTKNPETLDALISLTKANHIKNMDFKRKWETLTRDFLMAIHPSGELGKMLGQ